MREQIGKLLLDLAKLMFGGVILAGIMRQDISSVKLFTIGGVITLLLIAMGILVIGYNEKRIANKQ